MFTKYDKAIVALLMAVISIVQQATGLDLGLDQDKVAMIEGLVTSALVYLIPNKGT